MWGPAKMWPTFNLPKWSKSWKVRNAFNADHRRTIDDTYFWDYAIVYGKNDQKCGAAVIGSFNTTMPLITRPWVCSSFWHKQHDGYPSSSLFTRPCAMRLFFCSLVWKARWKGNVLLMSAKWKRKLWRSWTTSALKSSRNVFGSRKNVGTSVSRQKQSTLKETRFVIA